MIVGIIIIIVLRVLGSLFLERGKLDSSQNTKIKLLSLSH